MREMGLAWCARCSEHLTEARVRIPGARNYGLAGGTVTTRLPICGQCLKFEVVA